MMNHIQNYRKIIIGSIIFFTVIFFIAGISLVIRHIAKEVDILTKGTEKKETPVDLSLTVSSPKLEEAIHMSASYLLRACDDNGKFRYLVNLDPTVKLPQQYNILRHAGSIYSLTMYEEEFPAYETREVLERAVGFIKKKSIAPLPEDSNLLAVWSYPELNGSKNPVQAKLGGTGLGLVALLSAEKVMPGTTSIDIMRKMGDFIIFMQKRDGSFYSKYIPSKGGRNDEWISLYYPGEAALGLLMLYEKDPSQKWLDAAAKAIAYLARLRTGRSVVEPDHWALLATARLLPLYHRSSQPVPAEAILRHAIQISTTMLAAAGNTSSGSAPAGSLTGDGRTTPTSTRLEGLQAALTFLPRENEVLIDKIRKKASQGISFLINSQVTSGKYAGAMPHAVSLFPEGDPNRNGSDNDRATEVRIDYVQHALSAMIQHRRIMH